MKEKSGIGWSYIIFGSAAVCVAGALFVVSSRGKTEVISPKLAPVVLAFTVGNESSKNLLYTGTVHARVETDLGFRVAGKIIEKKVDAGQRVHKGQPLMLLDPNDLSLANLAAQKEVDIAQAELDRAIPDLKRIKELYELHAASEQDYQRAQAVVDAGTAKVLAAKANAAHANNQLGYTVLLADSDGIVIEVPTDVGQVVTAGQVVLRLAKEGTREAVINLPEQYLNKANSAKQAYLYSNPTELFPVKLRELSAVADKFSKTFQARYTLKDSGESPPLGSTVTVLFNNENQSGTQFNVPLGSIYHADKSTSVWVINEKNSTVYPKAVEILSLGQEHALVKGNIKAGDKIVALGAHLLKPNEQIRIARESFGD